jgi:hypothetical protein
MASKVVLKYQGICSQRDKAILAVSVRGRAAESGALLIGGGSVE